MMPIVLLLIFVAVLIGALLYSQIAAYRLKRCTLDELLAMLQPVPREGLTAIALDNLHPKKHQLRMDPSEMWAQLGGLDALCTMRENANVLLALAGYVERWNYDEGVIVTERMRRDAVQLRRAVFHLRLEMFLHSRRFRMPFYIHEAASAYYLMTQRLLALYETNHAGLYPRLAEVL